MRLLAIFAALALAGDGAERRTVTVLATTDLHGNIYPVDYATGRPAPRGLAKMATLIAAVRRENPATVLIDCGDTIQGSPLEFVYQTLVRTGRGPLGLQPSRPLERDPMMAVMNQLGYAAMAVGNHEYNFGLKCLNRARADASFPWLSANTEVAPGGSDKPFDAYVVKSVDGVRLAIVGLTTPAVPTWEKPENMGSYRFLPPVEPARRAVEKARREGRADLVIVAAHMGLARNRATGALESTPENPALDVARQVAGVDAMVTGHTHEELSGERIGTVLVAQPKNGGVSLARLDFTLEMRGGRWTPVSAASRLLLVKDSTPADAAILDLARPYHELAERYLATPVAVADQALEGTFGRVEDTPLVDAIQAVQLYYSKADVSLTSMFNTRARVPRGPVTVRQIVALYPYDNELYVIAATGRMLREALENAARYFVSCQGETCAGPPLINRAVPGFDFDMAQGVEYEIDLTRPAGSRVRNLRWHGRPLAPEQKLRLALNNYRAAGSAGYEMFRGAPILWQSGEEIRDLMVRYFTARKQFPDAADGNWRIVPDAARETLKRQAVAAARRPSEDQ